MKATFTHGAAAWKRGRCRCDVCRDANEVAGRGQYESRKRRMREDPSIRPHGLVSTYRNWGCRCKPCTDAQSQACADYYYIPRYLPQEVRA